MDKFVQVTMISKLLTMLDKTEKRIFVVCDLVFR